MHFKFLLCATFLCSFLYASAPKTEDGFHIPYKGYEFSFPRDHGAHSNYKVEWWYITGHLHHDGKRRFGFQATFFRFARPADVKRNGISAFEDSALHMAHMGISDLKTNKHIHQERLNREGWDAKASETHMEMTNGNWSLKQTLPPKAFEMKLNGSIRSEANFTLTLTPLKDLTFFGDKGVSIKGKEASAKSFYLTFTRLGVEGQLRFSGEDYKVNGQAWMDHEISSSQLDDSQVGWNWTSIQFHDNTELMLYLLRKDDQSFDEASRLYLIIENGELKTYAQPDFSWKTLRTWHSQKTDAHYPIEYQLKIKKGESWQTITVKPTFDKQEMAGRIGNTHYWEGAGTVYDEEGNEIGYSYTELTGFNQDLSEQL